MSASDSHQISSYNSDTISWSNKNELYESNELNGLDEPNELNEIDEPNELDESNELNDLNISSISENVHDLDTASNSSSPDQTLLHNGGVTVTNSLVMTKDEDGLEKECGHDYELTTGTGNLKSHLRQVHRILPPEENNNSQLSKPVSNQPSLHDFINKKTPLPTSKQDKITNQKLMQSVLFAEQWLKELLQTTMDSFCFTTDLWSQMHQPYIAVTIHWISFEFTLYQALLTIQKFNYPHTADRIEDFCRNLFDQWGIYEKLLGASTDNASSMIKAMDQLGVEHIGKPHYKINLHSA
ncbi:16344_t:CDS:2 [Gigaspora rosea]|nr:16344_t:CDS:2 [Gigaspora rosea]